MRTSVKMIALCVRILNMYQDIFRTNLLLRKRFGAE
jgi:hypothetical protein